MIFGKYTIAELRTLVARNDRTAGLARRPAYLKARAAAFKAIGNRLPNVADDLQNGDVPFRAILKACDQAPPAFTIGQDPSFGDIFADEFQQNENPDTAGQAVIKQAHAEDKPIPLTTAQKIELAGLQATGQVNAAGTAPGPGFFGSTTGHVLLGVGALAGLYFVSNIVGAIKR